MFKVLLSILSLLFLVTNTDAATFPASACTSSAIQAAVNSADNGDTVTVPSCTQTAWTGTVTITKRIILQGAGSGNTILQRSAVPATFLSAPMFEVSGVTGFEMKGFTLNGTQDTHPNEWADDGLELLNCIDFKIHDNNFTYLAQGIVVHGNPTVQKGVIYDNSFTGNYCTSGCGGSGSLGYGIHVYGNGTSPALSLGTETNVFIEHNTFNSGRHNVASNNGARYVFRYNEIQSSGPNAAAVDAHGYVTAWPVGTRQYEIYHNTLNYGNQQFAGVGIRGGDGVIFNNTITPATSNRDIHLMNDYVNNGSNTQVCSAAYPLPYQIRSLYIWGNKRPGGTDAQVTVDSDCASHIVVDRDFFRTPRNGYTAYTYPHPLRGVSTPDTVTGLLARYSMDQTTGTSAFDTSGADRHAVLNGTYAWVAGLIGTNALQFDGVTGYGQITGLMGNPAALTLAGHAQLLPGETSGDVISLGNYVTLRPTSTALAAHYWNGSAFISINYPVTLGSGWNHLAYTFGGGLHKLYINGIEVQSGTATAISWTGQGSNSFIGKHGVSATQFLNANLDEVRVYNRALSATDITALIAEAPSPPVVTITSPTSAGTYATSSNTISLAGSVSDNTAVASVTVSCPQCNPALVNSAATITGSTWAKNSIVLGTAPSTNVFTVKATDDQGTMAQTQLTVTYTTTPPTGGAACTRWASNNGSGNGLTVDTPYTVSAFLAAHKQTPGAVLCLKDGTYTGGSNIISTPSDALGTSTNPITIRALNDGKVTIDGQNGLRPGNIDGSYIVVEGMNFTRGDNKLLALRGSHNIARRVIAYEGGDNDGSYGDGNIDMGGTNNLVEDCAAFGKSRKQVLISAAPGGPRFNTVRRCWARWEDNQVRPSNPTNTYELGYGQDNGTYENTIANWNTSGRVTDPEGLGAVFRTWDSKWLGSIFYVRSSDTYNPSTMLGGADDAGSPPQSGDFHTTTNFLGKHLVAYIQEGHSRFNSVKAMSFSRNYNAPINSRIEDSVAVSGVGSTFTGGWVTSNVKTGNSLNNAIGAGNTIWTVVPGVCKQYINGVLTTKPLWPWPMNQRIKDALVTAGKTAVDVTQTMESLFGAIPAGCKDDSVVIPPTPVATNLTMISQPSAIKVCPEPGSTFQVGVLDQFGAPISTTGLDVTLNISNNPSGAELVGTTTTSTVDGVATFNNWCISLPGEGYKITAVSSGITGITSNAFTVTAEPVGDRLVFVGSITDVPLYSVIVPPITVHVINEDGLIDTESVATITLSIYEPFGEEELTGTLVKDAVAGVAVFNNVTIAGKPRENYAIKATSPGLAQGSTGISVVNRVATDQPSGSVINTPLFMYGIRR